MDINLVTDEDAVIDFCPQVATLAGSLEKFLIGSGGSLTMLAPT